MKNFLKKLAVVFILILNPALVMCAANKDSKRIVDALRLYENGFKKLKTALNDPNILNIYHDDKEQLTHFPFSAYTVVNVDGQGKFYLDQINDSIKNQLQNAQLLYT